MKGMKLKNITKTLLIAAGTISVVLAVLGMLLPVLPTTPFLLLAAYCYGRSSERFYHWLINNRWFGSYIRNYREGRGMTLRHKWITLSFLWLTIGISAVLVVEHWLLRILLGLIAVGVTIHLVRIKTEPSASLRSLRLPQDDLE